LCFYTFVYFWFVPLQHSSNQLQEIHELSLKLGDTATACISQCWRLQFLFFQGDRLSSIVDQADRYLQLMAKFHIGIAQHTTLDKELFDTLAGQNSDPYAIFNGEICNKESLLAHAQSKMHSQIVVAVHRHNFFVSFWMGDYEEAAKASDIAMSICGAKLPKLPLVCHIFFRGIVAFHHYQNGKGESWLDEGNAAQKQLENWVTTSKPIVENKLVLLEAEHYASMGNVVAAKESYELSIKIARDNGYIHEQGLAYECMGKYLDKIVEVRDAKRCFMSAYTCYMQWGAVAKADKLWKDQDLNLSTECFEISAIKRERDEDTFYLQPTVR